MLKKVSQIILFSLKNKFNPFPDSWIILTYRNGTRYNNSCGNQTRSASIIFTCGENTVRSISEIGRRKKQKHRHGCLNDIVPNISQ